ncbi:hypothetical protein Leryth_027384 [Lithospermum erythrorhizon]|nr:hypothetical protein Leryth_027384 [Lithospermum erythrorhizon]
MQKNKLPEREKKVVIKANCECRVISPIGESANGIVNRTCCIMPTAEAEVFTQSIDHRDNDIGFSS